MTVIISPNIKKVSERIDQYGNVINPRNKQIIRKNEPDSIPEPTPDAKISPTTNDKPKDDKQVNSSISDKINALVEAKIKEKIDAIVEQRVNEALKNI